MNTNQLNLDDYNESAFAPQVYVNCDEQMNYIPAKDPVEENSKLSSLILISQPNSTVQVQNSDIMEDISPRQPVLPSSCLTEWRNSTAENRSSVGRFSVESHGMTDKLSLGHTETTAQQPEVKINPFEPPYQLPPLSAMNLFSEPRPKLNSIPEASEASLGDSTMSPKQTVISTTTLLRGCNCKKSHCLKLYCECLASQKKCTSDCNCVDCHNVIHNDEEIKKALKLIKKKNPMSLKDSQYAINCNCIKSNCLRNYCFCYRRGLQCNSSCKCLACKNCELSSTAGGSLNDGGYKKVFELKHV